MKTNQQIETELKEFLSASYPEAVVNVSGEKSRREIRIVEESFKDLFPLQRYHFLMACIPTEYFDENLAEATLFELAPGEKDTDLFYHDEETVMALKDVILEMLIANTDFVDQLDYAFIEGEASCDRDFAISKEILTTLGFTQEEQTDIFHVFMLEDAFCDCEILYNIFTNSRLSQQAWREVQRGVS